MKRRKGIPKKPFIGGRKRHKGKRGGTRKKEGKFKYRREREGGGFLKLDRAVAQNELGKGGPPAIWGEGGKKLKHSGPDLNSTGKTP